MSSETNKELTPKELYESAKSKLDDLLKKHAETKQQIAIWAPVVINLALACGEPLSTETANLANEFGQDLGLTDAIRWVFRQPLIESLTPVQVRDHLAHLGYDLSKYAHEMPPIHNTLKRLRDAGEIEEVDSPLGRAFRLTSQLSPSASMLDIYHEAMKVLGGVPMNPALAGLGANALAGLAPGQRPVKRRSRF